MNRVDKNVARKIDFVNSVAPYIEHVLRSRFRNPVRLPASTCLPQLSLIRPEIIIVNTHIRLQLNLKINFQNTAMKHRVF